MNDLLIKNCRVVSARGIIMGNIYVNNGKIDALTSISQNYNARKIVDAEGLYALPGLVDQHVHMMDPGYPEREDFITGTRAAAAGGVTTVIEHHRTDPPVYSAEIFKQKRDYLSQRAIVDFCLLGGVIPDNIQKLKEIWDQGATGFKIFTCELHNQLPMTPGDLLECFLELVRFNGIALIHCEEDSVTNKSEDLLKKAGRNDHISHSQWRSLLAEEIAVNNVISLVKQTEANVIIAHVSHPMLLDRIKSCRNQGYRIYAESCPHYFYLSTEDLKRLGPWVKFAPAVREKEDTEKMWEKLNCGHINVIGSDHCPFPAEVKKAGENNIWKAPNGIPGVETSLKLMLNGVNRGLTTLPKIVETMCEMPAKLWGIFPRKGTLTTGADADIVLVDMDKREELANEKVISKCGWTPYAGLGVQGCPVSVFLRGQQVMKDGVVDDTCMGQFIPRLV